MEMKDTLALIGGILLLYGTAEVISKKTQGVIPNEFFHIQFEGEENQRFRLWCDGAIVKNYSAAEVKAGKSEIKTSDGLYTYILQAPPLSLSKHECFISQINPDSPTDFQKEMKSNLLEIIPECRLYEAIK